MKLNVHRGLQFPADVARRLADDVRCHGSAAYHAVGHLSKRLADELCRRLARLGDSLALAAPANPIDRAADAARRNVDCRRANRAQRASSFAFSTSLKVVIGLIPLIVMLLCVCAHMHSRTCRLGVEIKELEARERQLRIECDHERTNWAAMSGAMRV